MVPKNKVAEYKKMAVGAKKIWLKHGALEYYECLGDDLTPKAMGAIKPLAFTKLAKAKPGETVWFSFIVYRSKKHRDSVNAKVMAEMKKAMKDQKEMTMPFDMKRMAYGGFSVEVEG